MPRIPTLNGLATTLLKRPCHQHTTLLSFTSTPSRPPHLTTLAIETSCDDTCVSLLRRHPTNNTATLLFNKKLTSDNRAFGGVHPAVAVVGHTKSLPILLREALSSYDGQKPDFVTVTRGPGMTANLATGLNIAKGLALAWDVPLLGVNHMQAHALTPRLVSALEGEREEEDNKEREIKPEFPFLSLLVSGGHTMLVLSESVTVHRILVPNLSGLAIGDMLDKTARLLVPKEILGKWPDTNYAAALEGFVGEREYVPPRTRADEIATAVVTVDGKEIARISPPLAGTRRLAYEFAGLGTQVQAVAEGLGDGEVEVRRELGAMAMRLAFEHLASRVLFVLGGEAGDETRAVMSKVKTLVVSGGVARNKFLGRVLRGMLDSRGFTDDKLEIVAPPGWLCTDNSAMIAWTGLEMWDLGWRSEMDVLALRKWPVDERDGGGVLGVSGWVRR